MVEQRFTPGPAAAGWRRVLVGCFVFFVAIGVASTIAVWQAGPVLALGLAIFWSFFIALSWVGLQNLRRQAFIWNGYQLRIEGFRTRVISREDIERIDISRINATMNLTVRRRTRRRIRVGIVAGSIDDLLAFVNAVNQAPRYHGQAGIPVWKRYGTDGPGEPFLDTTAGTGLVLTAKQERVRKAKMEAVQEALEYHKRLAEAPWWRRRFVQVRPWLVLVLFIFAGPPLVGWVMGLFGFEAVHYASDPFEYVAAADTWIQAHADGSQLYAVSAGGFANGTIMVDSWNQTGLGKWAGDTSVWTYHYASLDHLVFTSVVAGDAGVLANWTSSTSTVPFTTLHEIRNAGQSVKGAFANQWVYKTYAAKRWGLVITDTTQGDGTTWSYFDSYGGRRQLDDHRKVKGNQALYDLLESFRLDYLRKHPDYLQVSGT